MNDYMQQGGRLMDPELIELLERRYEDDPPLQRQSLDPNSDEYADIYTRLCDAVIQLMWPEQYGTGPEDPMFHTSGPARQAANVLMVAAGFPPNR